jgi:hypothetical protein
VNAGRMTPAAKPATLLAEIYRLAGARDWDAVAARVHPDFTVHEAASLPFGGEWKGPDALQRVAAAMYGTWADASVDIHEIVGGDEWAVVVLSLTMTSKRTGRTFTQTVNEAGRFENGLLKELRIHYFDAAEVAAEA